MNDLGVIDRFMETFIRYIDSGFGLLSGDLAFLTTILIGIDITLAGLAWALGDETSVLGRLVRKVLYVGVFAFILNNFKNLADIVYRSFAGLGIKASAGNLSADNLLRPGRIAATGFEGAWPMLDQASQLLGFPEIFGNALTIFVLLMAWFLVIIAFFILSIQLFITILEFKLTTLAGFVLVPFALWNRSAFLAERVLGHVISSGIKVMVLAVIVGIGSTLFGSSLPHCKARSRILPVPCPRYWAHWHCLALAFLGRGSRRVLSQAHRSQGGRRPRHDRGGSGCITRCWRHSICWRAYGNQRRSRRHPSRHNNGIGCFHVMADRARNLARRWPLRCGCWNAWCNQCSWRRRYTHSAIRHCKCWAQRRCRARCRVDRDRRRADSVNDRTLCRFGHCFGADVGKAPTF